MNNLPKIVFSRTLEKAEWNNSILVKEIIPKEIEKLKQQPGKENGKLLQAGRFENGKQVGLWKRYQKSGKLYDVSKYVDGRKTGVWKIYDTNGTLSRTKNY